MIEKKLEYIANYLWQQSTNNIHAILSSEETKNFNISDYYYLTTIYQMGQPNMGEVAEKLNLTKPAISALVRRLLQKDLIKKIQSEEDRRMYFLEVTSKGVQIIEGDNKSYTKLAALIKNKVTEEQLKDIDCLLGEIVQILEQE